MSNYPPGVSGLEYEIAGADHEWEEEFECSNMSFKYVMISPSAFEYINKLSVKYMRVPSLDEVRDNLYNYLSNLYGYVHSSNITTDIQESKCGYVGMVDKQSYRDKIWWNCPRCGEYYSEQYEWDYYE